MFAVQKRTAILLALLSFSTFSAQADVVGTLSWDGSSNYITDSASDYQYLQLGLNKELNFFQVENMLQDANSAWSGFEIATQADAYKFVNSAIIGTGVALVDDQNSNVGEEWTVTAGPFNDGALGNNFDGDRDFFFFKSDFKDQMGLVELDSRVNSIMLRESNFTVFNSNNYAATGTSNESSWVSYLLVNRNTASDSVSPVPESNTFVLVGLGLIGFIATRKSPKARLA